MHATTNASHLPTFSYIAVICLLNFTMPCSYISRDIFVIIFSRDIFVIILHYYFHLYALVFCYIFTMPFSANTIWRICISSLMAWHVYCPSFWKYPINQKLIIVFLCSHQIINFQTFENGCYSHQHYSIRYDIKTKYVMEHKFKRRQFAWYYYNARIIV